MKITKSTLLAGVLALVSLTIVNCRGIHAPHTSNAQNALMCDKCKTTFVVEGTQAKGDRGYTAESGRNFVTYRSREVMTCPDCERAVTHFLRTGQLKHYCAHCGGTMTCGTAQ